jgi:hypothetical protein
VLCHLKTHKSSMNYARKSSVTTIGMVRIFGVTSTSYTQTEYVVIKYVFIGVNVNRLN